MASPRHILLFPHEQVDVLGAIHNLSVQSKTRLQLRTFLTAASTVVHRQAAVLDGPERASASIAAFEDLVELAEQHVSQNRRSIVVELVLLTTIQIGQLLVLAEDQPAILSTPDTSSPVGFGAGLIAASVASTATTPDAVVTLGLEAVAIAFRLAFELHHVAGDIEESTDVWARVVAGTDIAGLEKKLEEFNGSLRPLHRAYIGQVLPDSAVLFAPPSTLAALAQTADFPAAITSPTASSRGLLHGAHLPSVDVAKVVGTSPVLDKYTVQRPVYPLAAGTLRELWQLAVAQIAHKPLVVQETLRALATALEGTGSSDIVLTTVGLPWDASGVAKILSQLGLAVQVGEPAPLPKPFGDSIDSIPPDAIAVVGMSGRFPESDSLDEFWRLLATGTTTHQQIPSSRFAVGDFYDPSRSKHNALFAQHGCFMKNPGDFDHRLFNISPREAMQMDPVQRTLLMTTYEALEMAGYTPPSSAAGDAEQTPPRIATYFGQTTDDWKSINEQQGIDTHFLPGVNRGFAPGRLSHFFQWAGGFYSIDTGCSSSATAICLARDALTNGEYDAAVVGGGTLLTAPEWFAGLSQGGFLSPTGACKTYSDSADGYCRGEGVGVVVLKRLADAVRSKDNVLAVIAGAARNCNAGAGSITYPGEQAQKNLYRRVLRQAAVRPDEVGVVEMHGTGTQAGDRVETQAVHSVFASQRAQPLIVGALKANIGHSEAAAGIVSIIKAILILQHNAIPPQPNQPIKLNPYLEPLLGKEIQLANGQSWLRKGTDPRYIFVNNFDAAGGNVSVLLQDAPLLPSPAPKADERTHHVVVTSGRTATAHEANRSRLRQYLTEHPDTSLADLAYTTTARRIHHVHRDAYVAASTSELLKLLAKPLSDKTAGPAPSVVFAFTGQGSQHLGMGGKLYRTSPTFRRLLDSYQSLSEAQGLPGTFLNAIRASADDSTVTEVDMQVATVALEIALARYWQSLGVRPTLLLGHSLGEYAALSVARVLSVGDALALAYKRATLIFSRCPPAENGMLAVSGLPLTTLQYRLRDMAATSSGACEICCINGPTSIVVGGPVAAIEAFEEYLKSDDSIAVTTTRLRVQHSFHTRQMDVTLDDLEASAAQVSFHPPTIPVASTVLGRIVKPGEAGVFNANYLRRHTREPVAFLDAVRVCEGEGLIKDQSFVVEIGPHPTCIGLMAASLQTASVSAYPSLRRGRDDWESISAALAAAHRAQLPVAWAEFHKDHLDHLHLVSGLPTYAFDLKSFWHSYQTAAAPGITAAAAPVASSSAPVSSAQRLASTSLHSVEKVEKKKGKLLATFGVDLSDPKLAAAIGGHVVDAVAICPASIFIDMAYTAAAYLEKESGQVSGGASSPTTFELASLNMHSPLVLREDMEELPRVWVEGSLDYSTNVVSVRFLGRKDSSSTSNVEYGSGKVKLSQSDAPFTREWSRIQPLVKARVNSLNNSIRPREVHAMDTRLFYKIFSEIVDYSAPYHAVEEAIIAADFHDAAVVLHLVPTAHLGTFTSSPFVIDALVHVAGFLLNADVHRVKNEVHIANHIGSLRVLGDLSSQGPYYAYATIREQDAKAGTSVCDVYATDSEGKLVAICTDIVFKKLERDFFALLTGATTRAAAPKPRAKPTPRRQVQPVAAPVVVDDDDDDDDDAESTSSSSPLTPVSGSGSPASPSSLSDAVDLSTELLEAVAERSGVSVAEMKSSAGTTFTEMGVDSQMSIAILADFQRTTSVELPAAFFTNFPTPADVEKELGGSPLADLEDEELTPVTKKPAPRSPPKQKSKKQSAAASSKKQAKPGQVLLRLVADALGLEASDLTPSTAFESIGMDSMLSIKITAAFQNETQIELPAAFFSEHRTVAAAEEALDEGPEEEEEEEESEEEEIPAPKKKSASKGRSHPAAAAAKPTSEADARQHKLDSAVSRAVLIQGQSRSRDAPLFLTTDGSGTVESYIHLKALPKGRRIYALESPFLERPEVFDLTIEEMATIFLRTIRRIQPHGPYLIGGWSAGSMYAYEVAHRLTREGETIQALIILDMRAPSLIPTSIVTTDFVDKLGTFEGINRARDLPEDLSVKERAHLMATCRALSKYDAPAFPVDRQPGQVAVVWALLGLDNREDAPIASMGRPGLDIGKTMYEMTLDEFELYFNSWFYGRRKQFGTNGWETLLGDHISVYTVDGDHFSMMCPPFADAVGTIVAETVTRAVE